MAEYEIVKPKVDLRRKVKVLPSSTDFDPVANAEQAMQRLSVNFNLWMQEEVEKLHKAWESVAKDGTTEDSLQMLFRSAHDIKGQAQTMGFPIAGMIAGSICNLIENVPDRSLIPAAILQKHVQAITAVVHEDAREEDNAIGKALAKELIGYTQELVEKVGVPQD